MEIPHQTATPEALLLTERASSITIRIHPKTKPKKKYNAIMKPDLKNIKVQERSRLSMDFTGGPRWDPAS